MEHMAKAYGLNNPGSNNPCPLCRCNTSDVPWTDGRDDAIWRGTVWGNAAWTAAHPSCHPLFNLPGMGIVSYVPDILHVLHLGCYQYLFGSVLVFLVDHVMPGHKDRNLDLLWADIRDIYKDSPSNHPACHHVAKTRNRNFHS